jgi:predicted RNase H-like HicB family nuclease
MASVPVTTPKPLSLELTASFREAPEGDYIALVEELSGANTQGETLEIAPANLREVVERILDANRAPAEEDVAGVTVMRERLSA